MPVKGLEGMTGSDLANELARGGKFVVYQYCISIVVMTFKRSSKVTFVRADENSLTKGLIFSLLSFLLGWWGIPWGPIYTVQSLVVNFQGGKDVTAEVLASMRANQGV
jgi:hypothetical protein